jgi:hypothetical protein
LVKKYVEIGHTILPLIHYTTRELLSQASGLIISSEEWIGFGIGLEVHKLVSHRRRRIGAKAPLPRKRAFGKSNTELLRGDELEPQGKLRRVKTYLKPSVAENPEDSICRVAWSPNGELIASTTGWYRNVKIWDAMSGQELRSIDDYDIRDVERSPDGRLLVLVGPGVVRLWGIDDN